MKAFDPKTPDEIIVLGFDYSKLLNTGETVILPCVWTVTDSSGVSQPSVLSGPVVVAFSGTIAEIGVIGGLLGETYYHQCDATTSAGRYLTLGTTQRIVAGGQNVTIGY